MKKVFAKTGGAVLMLALGCWSPVSAQQFPFEPTPEGFKQYLNSLGKWDDGSEYRFAEIRDCATVGSSIYWCNSSDYQQSNLIGERTCINRNVGYSSKNNTAGFAMSLTYDTYDDSTRCGPYQKISAEPPKEKTPEPSAPPLEVKPDQIMPANRPGTITLNRNGAIFAGILIASASCLIGFLMGRSRKRDDDNSGFTYM